MKRLTYRTKDGWIGVNILDDKSVSPTSVAIHKLADIEDFMEEQGFENLEQLKDFMQDTKNAMLDVLKVSDRWKELKKYVEKYADNFDEGIASVCDLILMKMKELEKDD